MYKGKDKRPGDSVAPGDVYEYKWEIKEEAGPAQGDDACIPWPFHSHAEYPDKEINAGLVGVLLVCRKGKSRKAKQGSLSHSLSLCGVDGGEGVKEERKGEISSTRVWMNSMVIMVPLRGDDFIHE